MKKESDAEKVKNVGNKNTVSGGSHIKSMMTKNDATITEGGSE